MDSKMTAMMRVMIRKAVKVHLIMVRWDACFIVCLLGDMATVSTITMFNIW